MRQDAALSPTCMGAAEHVPDAPECIIILVDDKLLYPDTTIEFRFGYYKKGPYVGYPTTVVRPYQANIPPHSSDELPRVYPSYTPAIQIRIGGGEWVELGKLPPRAPLAVERSRNSLRFPTLVPWE